MKLCTFTPSAAPAEPRLGLIRSGDNRHVLDVRRAAPDAPQFASLQTLLESDDDGAWDRLRQLDSSCEATWEELSDNQWHAPLPRPASLRDCLSFELHWIQCARRIAAAKAPFADRLDRFIERCTGRSMLAPPRIWRQRPVYYKGNCRSVVGHGAEVAWPRYSSQLDFELEVAIYIGKQGANISPENAIQYVAGFSLFNDFSARDVQFREMSARLGPSKSKDFDTGNSLGPYLVTTDEVDLQTLTLEVAVNDETWAETDARSLYHSVPETIAFLSQSETLYPGDVIGLGTAPNGCGLELDRWLRVGDIVELRSNQLGVLRNRVVKRD